MTRIQVQTTAGYAGLGFLLAVLLLPGCARKDDGASFDAPEQAVTTFVDALEKDDVVRLRQLLGPGSEDLLSSGDAVQDKGNRAAFVTEYRAKHSLVADGSDSMTLVIGESDWPFPIPVTRHDGRWRFDADKGADELVYRRIGENELGAISVCRGVVDAELEYAAEGHDGDSPGIYALKLISDGGLHNGLYWPTGADEDASPAGPFIASAEARRPMEEIIAELRDEIEAKVPELAIEFVPLVQDQINDLAGVASPIEVKIFGPDVKELRVLAKEVGEIVESVPGAADVNANVRMGNPDIVIRPDSVETQRVGITEFEVENQLSAALYGQIASTVPEEDRMTSIRVRYTDRVRFDRQHLEELPISLAAANAVASPSDPAQTAPVAPSPGPAFVQLGQLAKIEIVRSPNESWRENQQPVITVTAELDQRDLGAVNRELQTKLSLLAMPAGYRWELAGNYLSQQESFRSLLIVLIASAVLVFLMLAVQFKSLTLPLLVFLAQPLSFTSALFALWITGTPLNVSSFMGAILLVGLDVKNGIILVEYIGQLRATGMTMHDAVLKAGKTRFRPILMTSLTAIFALLPLAFGIGPGAQMQRPLAIAVIGGLTANMLFTRLLIPVGYQFLGVSSNASNRADATNRLSALASPAI